MPRLFLVSLAVASMLGFGWVTRAFAGPWRRAVVEQEFDKAERVDLLGLASIELPSSFKPVGRGWGSSREGHSVRRPSISIATTTRSCSGLSRDSTTCAAATSRIR